MLLACFLLAATTSLAATTTPAVTTSPAGAGGLLLVHDAGPHPASEERRAIAWMSDLLGHFSPNVSVLPVESYQAGMMKDREATVFLGLWEAGPAWGGAALPEQFLSDCREAVSAGETPALPGRVCWLGANLGQLVGGGFGPSGPGTGRFGFRVEEAEPGARPSKIVYRGMPFWREARPLPRIVITQPEFCRVVAVAEAEGKQTPYAVQEGSFLYFAEVPFAGSFKAGAHLVLCDQMHELLDRPHDVKRTALVLIADVGPETDSTQVADQVRRLQALGVPFAVEVRAFGPRGSSLSRRRGLVSVLRGAQRAGASIIASLPPGGGSPARVGEHGNGGLRVATGKTLGELSRCGLYPLAWSLDRGDCSEADLVEGAHLFSTVLAASTSRGGVRPEDRWEEVAPMPFIIGRDQRGQCAMPGALSVLTEGRGEVEEILESARAYTSVPDPWATVGISPAAPAEAVTLLINGLRNGRYEPVDLRYSTNWTKADTLQVYSVEAQHHLSELVAEGWEALLVGPKTGRTRQVTAAGHEEALVRPGAIVVAYPVGKRPEIIFTFEGDPQQVAQRAVYGIARAVAFLALFAIAILTLIYFAQILQGRGRSNA